MASQQLEWRDAIPLQDRRPVSGPAAVSRQTGAVMPERVRKLEQQVTAGSLGNAEEFPDQMFRARHGLLR